MLLLAFVCTAAAKAAAVHRYGSAYAGRALAGVVLADGVFFVGAAGALAVGYLCCAGRAWARVALGVAAVILLWSLLNAAWVTVTGVQLQRGVLGVVLRHPAEFWPTVEPQLRLRAPLALGGAVAGVCTAVWMVWRLARPMPVRRGRRVWAWRAAGAAIVLAVLGGVQVRVAPGAASDSLGQVLGYSSHWWVVQSLAADEGAAAVEAGGGACHGRGRGGSACRARLRASCPTSYLCCSKAFRTR